MLLVSALRANRVPGAGAVRTLGEVRRAPTSR